MRWTAPIELFIDIAAVLWLLKIFSGPVGSPKPQRNSRSSPTS